CPGQWDKLVARCPRRLRESCYGKVDPGGSGQHLLAARNAWPAASGNKGLIVGLRRREGVRLMLKAAHSDLHASCPSSFLSNKRKGGTSLVYAIPRADPSPLSSRQMSA